ncbi:hypothetical protein DMENIID0001_112320 [Sergentomyia squamirostris]
MKIAENPYWGRKQSNGERNGIHRPPQQRDRPSGPEKATPNAHAVESFNNSKFIHPHFRIPPNDTRAGRQRPLRAAKATVYVEGECHG